MKRKILSLALALMMILSVAAAMPVSATAVDDVILNTKVSNDYPYLKNITFSGTSGYTENLETLGGTAEAWATKSYASLTTSQKSITWTFDVP